MLSTATTHRTCVNVNRNQDEEKEKNKKYEANARDERNGKQTNISTEHQVDVVGVSNVCSMNR